MARPLIGLVMIVKNEASVIERCLDSARPLIDYVLISDTGSTDGTQEIIRRWLADNGIAGHVIERPWQNFAHNRSEALAALREVQEIDYALTIDADETFRFDSGIDIAAVKGALAADVYELEVHYSELRYRRPCLFSNRKPFRYRAVLHEFLEAPPGASRAHLDGVHVHVTQDGARSRNENKFLDDAKVLEEALKTERDPLLVARYCFYLAQSYRDAGDWQRAYDTYLARTELGQWDEEIYVSLLRAATASAQLGHPADAQLALCLRAYDLVPARAEALCEAASVCRVAGRYQLGYLLARAGLDLTPPATALFTDATVYNYRLLDELQIAAYWTGRHAESLAIAERLLAEAKFPPSERERLVANANYAREKVGLSEAPHR